MLLQLPEPEKQAFTRSNKRAEKKLGPPPSRPKYWVSSYFWRAFNMTAETNEYIEACKKYEVSPHTVRAYLTAVLKDSNSTGKDVWTGLKKIAKRINREYRTAQRARAVVRVMGYEKGARRCWVNPKHGGIVSASARLRFAIPQDLEETLRKQKQDAAKKTRTRQPKPVYDKPSATKPKLLEQDRRPKIEEYTPEAYKEPSERERAKVKETLAKLRRNKPD